MHEADRETMFSYYGILTDDYMTLTQAWCMLLNDKVLFRMHWPQFADLQVNGALIRTTNRPGTQLLGANGRDDGPAIKTCTREGINKISLSGCDARVFCLGVRIVKRRTVQQVLNIILRNTDGEPFEDALARVRRCVGGGNSKNDADSDSDVEVVADSIPVNLRCPMSASRIKTAGRFKPCAHMGGFDLDTFVELNQRSRKASIRSTCFTVSVCFFSQIAKTNIVTGYSGNLLDCGEDVTEIDVRPDGSWRAKNENERLDLLQWHLPDGSLCVPTDKEMKSNLEVAKQIKQEGASDGCASLKLGIKKNQNGLWEVSKPEEMRSLSSGPLELKCERNGQKAMPMSSSATGSCRGSEDMSVNQDDGGQSHFSANNGNKQDAVHCFEATYGVANRSPAPVGNADVIVLSDSDDENGNLISSDNIYVVGRENANCIPFPVTSEVPGSYPEDPGVGTAGLGLFDGDDTRLSWPMQSGTSAAFELFGGADVSDSFVGLPHTSDPCSQSMNGFALASDVNATSAQDPYAVCQSGTDRDNGLVNNSLFNGDDTSMQIFLPSRPAGTPVQGDTRDQPDISEGVRKEDWISLRLGGGGGGTGGQGESSVANGLNYGNQVTSKDSRLESLANTASLLLSMNGDGSEKKGKEKRSEGPFSHPRQPRSVRPRLYLSIDSDSD
ncbi:hypothetical protein Syun_001140 [Stephania yunnanensis]|uniref:SP-RING-type domain-containing protein n=1 Tax=Stephania yunnanensis TaxID=152371 RepID=A0AAP0Q673_9MAGN